MKEALAALGSLRTQAVLLLLLAFGAGAFAGGAFERVAGRRAGGFAQRGMRGGDGRFEGRGGPGGDGRGARGYGGRGFGGRGGPGANGRGRAPAYLDSIGLTTTQRARIDSIVQRRSVRTDSLMKLSRALYDSTRHDIDSVLTKEQRDKLEAMRPRGFRPRP